MPNAIAIIAHHDDHFLWIGGTIQRLAMFGWHWTIIAMCVPELDKRNYFLHSCSVLGSIPISMQFDDYSDGEPFSRNNKDAMNSSLLSVIDDHKYDLVFTHSRNKCGEYWWRHPNHFEVRDIVTELVINNILGQGIQYLAYFSYDVIYGSGTASCAMGNANYYLPLTYPELLCKCELCNLAPDADSSLKNLGYPCPNPEGFEGDQLNLPEPFVHPTQKMF